MDATHRLFLTLFFTATEGRNLLALYLRNADPVGLGERKGMGQ